MQDLSINSSCQLIVDVFFCTWNLEMSSIFGWGNLSKEGEKNSNQNRGHLGSRYVIYHYIISYLIQFDTRYSLEWLCTAIWQYVTRWNDYIYHLLCHNMIQYEEWWWTKMNSYTQWWLNPPCHQHARQEWKFHQKLWVNHRLEWRWIQGSVFWSG